MTRSELDRLNHRAWLAGFMVVPVSRTRYSIIDKPDMNGMLKDGVDPRVAVASTASVRIARELNRWLENEIANRGVLPSSQT